MNKILVPLNNKMRLPEMVDAGVDEFYMGFHDQNWKDSFGEFSEINRMSGFGYAANPYSLEELLEIVDDVKKYKKAIFITINSANAAIEIPDAMKQTMAQEVSGMPSLLNLVVSMILVIAMIYLTGWIYNKLNIVNKNKLKSLLFF